MTSGIYTIQEDGTLVEMRQEAYISEDLLQQLLADYPNLLAGDLICPQDPRNWLLVRREMGIPTEEKGVMRFSIDHMFLDQDAIPTLVEVKRSSDTRIRREVVGQMLDYAANVVTYWPEGTIRTAFETSARLEGRNPDSVLEEFLEKDKDTESFWQLAEENLKAGRIRMLFVADFIPQELRRIVEFLNEQMSPAEVLAVEIKQYLGQNQRTLVPRVYGQSVKAQQKSTSRTPKKNWGEISFFDALEENKGGELARLARRIMTWARKAGYSITWGSGSIKGSIIFYLEANGKAFWPISIYTDGTVYVSFHRYIQKPPFDSEILRLELLERINRAPSIQLPEESIHKQPALMLEQLSSSSDYEAFSAAFEWFAQTVRQSHSSDRA